MVNLARRRRFFFSDLGAECGPLQVKNGKYGPQAKTNELIRTPLGIFDKIFGVNKDPPKISDFEILMKIRTP